MTERRTLKEKVSSSSSLKSIFIIFLQFQITSKENQDEWKNNFKQLDLGDRGVARSSYWTLSSC